MGIYFLVGLGTPLVPLWPPFVRRRKWMEQSGRESPSVAWFGNGMCVCVICVWIEGGGGLLQRIRWYGNGGRRLSRRPPNRLHSFGSFVAPFWTLLFGNGPLGRRKESGLDPVAGHPAHPKRQRMRASSSWGHFLGALPGKGKAIGWCDCSSSPPLRSNACTWGRWMGRHHRALLVGVGPSVV